MDKWFIAEYEKDLGFDKSIILAFFIKAKNKDEAKAIFNKWASLIQELENESNTLVRITEISSLNELSQFPSLFLSRKDVEDLESLMEK